MTTGIATMEKPDDIPFTGAQNNAAFHVPNRVTSLVSG
jgi:hypothetical protein